MTLIINRLFCVLPRAFLSVLLILLSACSFDDSGTSLFDDPVSIESIGLENLAPASWTFRPKTDLVLTSYQWSFSDGDSSGQANQSAEVSHTFQEPGVYDVRLDYVLSNGAVGSAGTRVIVSGGAISGRILAAADNLVDIDTLELESRGDNNSYEKAQIISSKTQLSGVVDDRDLVDIYQVQLQKNQRLMIQMADDLNVNNANDPRYNRVKLTLYTTGNTDQAVNTIETSAQTGRFSASLLVPEDGSYYLEITAIEADGTSTLLNNTARGEEGLSSHGIYSLSIGAARVSSSAEFALGEVNVLLKPNRQYMAQGLRTQMDLGRFKTLSLDDARALMESAKITYASTPTLSSMGSKSVAQASLQQQRWEVLQAVEILSQHEDVEIAEPNWKRYPLAAPVVNDPDYASQWHYDTINLPKAWSELGSNRGEGVVVAVIDTGVLTGHPDLSANIITGYDYVDNDADANDTGDKSINGQRSSFHGTHVAGTIAALSNDIGGVGIAPDVEIMPIRVLGEGGGYASDIIAGVCFAAKLNIADCESQENYGNAVEADVINLSLGGEGFSELENRIYKAATTKGKIIIAAAGNSGVSEPFYPAAYNSVISVSAVSQDLTKASYSNFADPAKNSKIDVAAPGGDFTKDRGIYSTLGDDSSGTTVFNYGSLQGTSMAAPHVAGIAALMKSVKADLTHNEFLTYLRSGDLTQDLGDVGRDDIFGYGLIDAHKAILFIKDGVPPQLLSSSYSLFFNIGVNTLSFVLSATNDLTENDAGVLSVKSIKDADNQDVSWLSLDAVVWGENRVTINRTGLAEGRYQADVVINSTTLGDLTIRMILQVGNPEVSANAGVQYVLLIDADAEPDADGILPTVAGSAPLVANKGEYFYQITDIKKGRYLVSTGSDLDFDNVICDAGESCGQYPTLEQPKIITISEDTPFLELDMSVNYSFGSSLTQGLGYQNSTIGIKPKPVFRAVNNKEINPDNQAPFKVKAQADY